MMEPRSLSAITQIQEAVAKYFGVTAADLTGKDRFKSIAFARHVAMYLVRRRTQASFPDIGRAFGNRDHTTAMSGVQKIERMLAEPHGADILSHIDKIKDALSESHPLKESA